MECFENLKWEEISNKTRSFQLGDEPEVIHIINTGFRDRYMVVHEDAYELNLGKVEFMNARGIFTAFGIDIL